jgi:hypothetical protein
MTSSSYYIAKAHHFQLLCKDFNGRSWDVLDNYQLVLGF